MTDLGPRIQTHMPPGEQPRAKGPIVFLDYDQEEIDAAYDQMRWASNLAEVRQRHAQQSAAALARLGPPQRIAYGLTEVERLDLYTTKQPNAPVNVFIHGGAWREGSAATCGFLAEIFVDAGAHFIALDFSNVLETNGDLMTVAGQVRRAVAWVHNHASTFDGDPNRLYVSGHSSGAHLAGVVLTTDWEKHFNLPPDTVKGGLCCSGMYDLFPVSLSARSKYVKFTAEVVDALSPLRHLDKLSAPLIVAHGTLETPEFVRQSREFASAVKAAAKPVRNLAGEGYNHFEIIGSLANPYGLLGRAVLDQMELAAS